MSRAPEPAELFSALSDGLRLRLLAVLRGGEFCVSELVEAVGVPQYRVSRHLRALRQVGLLERHRAGRWIWYRVAPERAALVEEVLTLARQWEEPGRPRGASRRAIRWRHDARVPNRAVRGGG
jgi:ArsR family transcriptional regulator